jgi:hypothetical protein
MGQAQKRDGWGAKDREWGAGGKDREVVGCNRERERWVWAQAQAGRYKETWLRLQVAS